MEEAGPMEALREALGARGRAQHLLKALDAMRTEGAATDAEYQQIRAQRLLELNEGMAAVEAARERLRAHLASQETEAAAAAQALQDLAARIESGQVPAEPGDRDLEEVARRCQALEAEVNDLKAALAAASPDGLPIAPARAAPPPTNSGAALAAPPAAFRPPLWPEVQAVVDLLSRVPTPRGLTQEAARRLTAGAGAFLAFVALVVPAAGTGPSAASAVMVQLDGTGLFCLLLTLALVGLYFVSDCRRRAVTQLGVCAFLLLLWLLWLMVGPGSLGHWQVGFFLFFLGLLPALLGGVTEVKSAC